MDGANIYDFEHFLCYSIYGLAFWGRIYFFSEAIKCLKEDFILLYNDSVMTANNFLIV